MLSLPSLEMFTRIGFAARGLMYVVIGYLALRFGQAESGEGALATLAEGSGKLLLGIMALGFAAYGCGGCRRRWSIPRAMARKPRARRRGSAGP
jgi:hypothetical protein